MSQHRNLCHACGGRTSCARPRRKAAGERRAGGFGGGQAMVEFALLSGLVVIVLLVGVQIAIIGNAMLSVNQLSYVGARYASVNPTDSSSTVEAYMQAQASPTIQGSNLTTTLTTQCEPSPNTMGSQARVDVQYTLGNKVFLPNPFMGVINFPTSVSSTQYAYCE